MRSGLICLNWYDWNSVNVFSCIFNDFHSRDWSAWIDTIETWLLRVLPRFFRSGRDWSAWIAGLICLNWYDWNLTEFLSLKSIEVHKSGLICLNWYDWNSIRFPSLKARRSLVGIDLPELIRLKPSAWFRKNMQFYRRDWSAWIDTIETSKGTN